MSSINGINTADIDNINGLGVNHGVPVGTSGVLWTNPLFVAERPTSGLNITGQTRVNSWQFSTRTDIIDIKYSLYSTFALSSANVLYSSTYPTQKQNIGRPSGLTDSEYEELGESLTNVAKFAPSFNVCFAVKTDGTLWWCGQGNQYITTSGSGQGTTNSFYGWLQYGTDTDWVDVVGFASYPYTVLAIKGSAGSQYLHGAGYNANYRTGQGTTSGIVYDFARVKSGAAVDWSASISKVAMDSNVAIAVTESGELYTWGEGQNGTLGTGTLTDYLYPNQIGVDTDWQIPFAEARASYVIKTDGTLWACLQSNTYFRIIGNGGVPTLTFNQVGTDTDYEYITTMGSVSPNVDNRGLICAKKNGSWYVNAALKVGDWSQTLVDIYDTYSGIDTWYAYNDALQANDVTKSINFLSPTAEQFQSSLYGQGIIVALAAT